MEGCHGDNLAGEHSLVPPLSVILSFPRTFFVHTVGWLAVTELSSKRFDVMLDLPIRSIEGEASYKEGDLPPPGRPHLNDRQVPIEL